MDIVVFGKRDFRIRYVVRDAFGEAEHTAESIEQFPVPLTYAGYCYVNGELVHYYL